MRQGGWNILLQNSKVLDFKLILCYYSLLFINLSWRFGVSAKRVTHKSNFPIQPGDIDTKIGVHFWDAFDHSETEVSAKWLVRLAQRRGGWHPFTYDQIETFYNIEGNYHNFSFNRLIKPEIVRTGLGSGQDIRGGGWIIHEKSLYYFTVDFIERCYKSSPA